MSKKFIYSFCAGLALLGMASCSNDDMVNSPVITADNATGYARISISFPEVSGTRATGDYANGTDEEQAVKKIYLALYDSRGTYVGKGTEVSTSVNPNPSGDQITAGSNVSNKLARVFSLELNEGANVPSQVVAFINTDLQTVNLDQLNAGYAIDVTKLGLQGGEDMNNGFPMSNSGYYDENSNWVMAVPFKYVEGETIYDTKEEAAGSADKAANLAATIHVERLAAKVAVKTNDLKNNPNYKVEDVLEKEITLEYTPKSWSVTGFAKQENVAKSKFNTEGLFADYNKYADFRSFWAEGTNYEKGISSYLNTNGSVKEDSPLSYITFGDVKKTEDGKSVFTFDNLTAMETGIEYVPEHTTVLGCEKENLLANSYVIVVGNYEVKGDNKDWFKNAEGEVDFYLLLKGVDQTSGQNVYTAYNKAQLIGILLNYNGITSVKESAGGTAVSTVPSKTNTAFATFEFDKYFDLVADGDKYALAEKADAEGTLFDQNDTELTWEADKFKENTNSKHYYYPTGAAYFNAKIEHKVKENADVVYGVVRNHAYTLTITEVNSLGAPIDDKGGELDPSTPIVPPVDELKDHFINAQINVLSWHDVESNVKL